MFLGYGVIVLLTSFGFNVVPGGRTLYGGPPLVLAAGMLVAVIAGLVGGYSAGFIGPGRALLNASLVLLPRKDKTHSSILRPPNSSIKSITITNRSKSRK